MSDVATLSVPQFSWSFSEDFRLKLLTFNKVIFVTVYFQVINTLKVPSLVIYMPHSSGVSGGASDDRGED